jgi:hypothetical protein
VLGKSKTTTSLRCLHVKRANRHIAPDSVDHCPLAHPDGLPSAQSKPVSTSASLHDS